MNLSCSSKVIKYLMFVFNFIFVLTGIIILSVGVTVKAYYYEYDTFLDEKYFSLPNLLIATGALIFIVSFFGCYGAIKENWILLAIFSMLLIIIFIFEFSAGIAGYVLRDKTASYLEARLEESLTKYKANPEVTKMWDTIQRGFECCGVNSPADWYAPFNNSYELPLSCCPAVDGTTGAFYCNAAPISNTTVTTTAPSAATNKTDAPSTIVTVTTTEATTTASSSKSSSTSDSPTETPKTTRKGTVPLETNARRRRSLLQADAAADNDTATVTTMSPSTSTPYQTGCESAFGDFVRKHAVQIGGCAMALAVIQFIGILFSCHLARQLKNGYYST